jgi:hypothetical protein
MISTKLLRQLSLEATDLPEWLLDECYHSVGDLAETLALLLPPPTRVDDAPLDVWMNERLLPLRERDDAARLARCATGSTPCLRRSLCHSSLVTANCASASPSCK